MRSRADIAGAALICALALVVASPALACPAAQPCAVRSSTPSTLQIDLATAQWRQAEPGSSADAAEQPAARLWSALVQRIEDRLPHRADHGRAIVAAPMIVTGAIDSVPGLAVGGAF
jgi:hypothetical protein